MAFYLPNEIWSVILRNLYTWDLLKVRLVSNQFNHASLYCLKSRKIQVTIRNDTELVEYCNILPNCSSRLHEDVNLNFVLHPISIVILKGSIPNLAEKLVRCTLNILIEKPNENDLIVMGEKLNTIFKYLTKLRNLEVISDEWTSTCKVDIPQMLHLENLHLNITFSRYLDSRTQYLPIFLNSITQVSPNIKSLILKGYAFFGKFCGFPPSLQLKKLSVQCNQFFYTKRPHTNYVFGKGYLNQWIKNAPALEIFEHDSHFGMEGFDYLSAIQHIKHAKPHLLINKHSFRRYYMDSSISGKLVGIEMELFGIRKECYKDITKLLSSQTESLEVLKLNDFGICNTLEIPVLKKLHTFDYHLLDEEKLGSILPFKPEIFPNLKFLSFINENFKAHPFTGVYPTIETLRLNYLEGWQHIFPNVKSFTGDCRSHKELLLLDLTPEVQSLELCINLSYYGKNSEKDIWNILTGNARIEDPGSMFYIKGVNDEDTSSSSSESVSIPILPNLTILKVKDSRLVHVAALAFITVHHKFKTFQKLEFHIKEEIFQTISKEFIRILKDNHNVIFYSIFYTWF